MIGTNHLENPNGDIVPGGTWRWGWLVLILKVTLVLFWFCLGGGEFCWSGFGLGIQNRKSDLLSL